MIARQCGHLRLWPNKQADAGQQLAAPTCFPLCFLLLPLLIGTSLIFYLSLLKLILHIGQRLRMGESVHLWDGLSLREIKE